MATNNDEWVRGFRMRCDNKPMPLASNAERRLGWMAADALFKLSLAAGYGNPVQ